MKTARISFKNKNYYINNQLFDNCELNDDFMITDRKEYIKEILENYALNPQSYDYRLNEAKAKDLLNKHLKELRGLNCKYLIANIENNEFYNPKQKQYHTIALRLLKKYNESKEA